MQSHFYISITQGDNVISLPFLDDLMEADHIFKSLTRLKNVNGEPALDTAILNQITVAAHDSLTIEIKSWERGDA